MITFEQVEFSMHKWAGHFSNKQFEHWELINAVWAMGSVQKLKRVEFASMRIKYDMLEYIREQTNSRRKLKPKFVSLENKVLSMDEGRFRDIIDCKNDHTILTKEFFQWATFNMTRTKQLVVKLRYIEDFSLLDIGITIGISEAMVSVHLADALHLIHDRLVRAGVDIEGKSDGNSKDTKRHSIYNNIYYNSTIKN